MYMHNTKKRRKIHNIVCRLRIMEARLNSSLPHSSRIEGNWDTSKSMCGDTNDELEYYNIDIFAHQREKT